jgi:hypothetical protein
MNPQHWRIISMIVLPLLLIMFFSNGMAQDKQFATKGTTELSGTISYSNFTMVSNGETSDNDLSIFTVAPQIGYFVTDGFELGLGTGISLLPGYSVLSPSEGESTNIFQLFLAPSFNLRTENKSIYPFLEAQLGYTSMSSGDNTESGFSYGGRVGVKFVASNNFLITLSGQYLLITLNPEGADERNGLNYLTIGVGVSGFF